MPTEKQRREAARRHLERQLQRRQQREVKRRRFTLVASIAGTLALVAVIIVWIAAVGDDNKGTGAADGGTTVTDTNTASPSPTPTPSTSYAPAKGKSVTFLGVTVKGATDLTGIPGVTSHASKGVTKLQVKDLVVGTGAAASPQSTVTVQYYGALYKNGKMFDSSWSRGMPAEFSLAQVVPGFVQGIGGTTGVEPMKVGGRRIIIMPPSLGYGSKASGSIPANSTLVFIVDLVKVAN